MIIITILYLKLFAGKIGDSPTESVENRNYFKSCQSKQLIAFFNVMNISQKNTHIYIMHINALDLKTPI